MNDPYLVFGTGRSGTSFTAGVLHNELGISMGLEFVPANRTNPDGFYEDIDFYNLNKAFVYHKMPYDEFYNKAQLLVKKRSESGETWGFKESRMAYLLPIYLSMFDNPKLIWTRRDKDLTIQSLKRCYGWGDQEAENLFNNRETLIRRALNGRKYLEIQYGKEKRSIKDVAAQIAIGLKDPIKLYIAILNKGWIRREVTASLLPEIRKMDGVIATLENPNKTWDHPISSNRNQIVKRFLATDNEYLMMLDNDVVPLSNPVKFIFANKDIIGFPAKVRQGDRQLSWVAYVKHPDRIEYSPVDFSNIDQSIDLLKVDAIGTGCILIHRRVLENMKAPFHIKFDEDGILSMGTDFAFSEKASEAGFEIFTTPKLVCEHFKELGLLDMASYNDCDYVDSAARKYEIPWGGMAINPIDWEFIKRIILDTNTQNVLEFGCGLSSLLISEYCDVTSIESNNDYSDFIKKKALNGSLKIENWDDASRINADFYDLIFIDGPIGKQNGGPGREDSFKIASKGKAVIVHDAGRKEEMELQEKYLMKDFKLIKRNGWHQSRCQYWVRNGLS